jgi:DNA-binding IclR family transcriptional regulator
MGKDTGVGVLDKAVDIIASLHSGPASLGELQERTGLPRATAHRLAVALEQHGFVRRDSAGRFVLGARLIGLGRAATAQFDLAGVAAPLLSHLRDESGESIQLYVRQGDARLCIASLDSPNELRTIVEVGALLPLDRGSAGPVLLGRVTKPWAESVGEREAGVASVSAPVRDRDGTVIAAVSLSGPIERLGGRPGRRYGPLVAAAADDLSAQLRG